MSNNDEVSAQDDNETAQSKEDKSIKLTPLYQQFTHKILALFIILMVMLGLVFLFIYQNNVHNNALVQSQLLPLKQQFEQTTALHKAENLIAKLLNKNNVEKYVGFHSDLISINRQLLQQQSVNEQVFQLWLNENQLSEDIASRIQDGFTRNQQLKQSSIIQLQLILVSLTPVIENEIIRQKLLHKQLKVEQSIGSLTYKSTDDVVKSVQQSHHLQQLNLLLTDILLSFEQLNVHTSYDDFEQLRVKTEQVFLQHKQILSNATTNELADVNQQFKAFEEIALTEQRALSKWQGYIRLAQDYKLGLEAQQQKINTLLDTPYQYAQVSRIGMINQALEKIDVKLSHREIIFALLIMIGIFLLLFFFILLRLRKQIKNSTNQVVVKIKESLKNPQKGVVANCAETQEIIGLMQDVALPKHNEDDFQKLLNKYDSTQQLLAEEQEKIERLTQCNEQLHIDSKEIIEDHRKNEIQRYNALERCIVKIIQQYQKACFNQKSLTVKDNEVISIQLQALYQQLAQYHLAVELNSEQSTRELSDINLVDELHAIVFNKQQEQKYYDNQLYIFCDEQRLRKAKLDTRIFQQLINLYIDIALTGFSVAQLNLHVQLKDKSTGQQLIHFSAKVHCKPLDRIPEIVNTLISSQSTLIDTTPKVDTFNTLFAKQFGENIVAQLNEDGYKISFELPIAIAEITSCQESISLENVSSVLVSQNSILSQLIENIILSSKGDFEKITDIDNFSQQLSVQNLNRKKVDVIIITSDIACDYIDDINQRIASLPNDIKPKLMVLQSKKLPYERFGFYSLTEQVVCKDTLLLNIVKLLESNDLNNQLLACDEFVTHKIFTSELTILLAVKCPQQYQNLQRLLHWLGFHVYVVTQEIAQQALWKTGQYSLLITEFAEASLIEMESKPVINIGVFSLTNSASNSPTTANSKHWHIGTLRKNSTLLEVVDAMKPWLKQVGFVSNSAFSQEDDEELNIPSESVDELVITELAEVYAECEHEAAFDFSQYLKNQGTVELALFMMDEYALDNHHQLDRLIDAIKAKNIEEAKLSISGLTLNAKILSASELQVLCAQWVRLLDGTDISSNLDDVKTLLKDTQTVLHEIDEYAETI